VAEGKLAEAEREAKRANEQLNEKSKQYEGLKAQFDPLFDETGELKKKLNAKEKELKVLYYITFSLLSPIPSLIPILSRTLTLILIQS
jgi:hypothetical protein